MPEGETALLRRTKKVVRFSRRVVLGVLLLASVGLLWLNYVGLPSAVRKWVLRELNRKNFDLQVAQVRMEGFSRVLVEQVRFRPAVKDRMATLSIEEGEILLDPAALLRFQFVLRGVNVHQGRLDLEVQEGAPPFSVSNVRTELLFLPDDTWSLTRFNGESLGVDVTISATITNASTMATQRPMGDAGGAEWRLMLSELAQFARTLRLPSPPKLSLKLYGDARDWKSFRATTRLSARQLGLGEGSLEALDATMYLLPGGPGLRTYSLATLSGWKTGLASLRELNISGSTEWTGGTTNRLTGASWELAAAGLSIPWGKVEEVTAQLVSTQRTEGMQFSTRIEATATPVWTEAGQSGPARFSADVAHTSPLPSLPTILANWAVARESEPPARDEFSGTWDFHVENLVTLDWRVGVLHLEGQALPHPAPPPADPALGFWSRLRHMELPFSVGLTNAAIAGLEAETITAGMNWRFPELAVTNLVSSLYDGAMTGEVRLDVQARRLTTSSSSSFDYRRLAHLFGSTAQEWLAQTDWPAPPKLDFTAALALPEWTNSWTGAERLMLQTATFHGQVNGGGTVRGLEILNLATGFTLSNSLASLTNCQFEVPGGSLGVSLDANLTNTEFRCALESALNPASFAPWVDERGRKVLDFVQFQQAPLLQGELSGRWDDLQTLAFVGSLAATNLLVRGETVADITTGVRYSNLVIECDNVVVHRVPQEVATVPYARIDIPREVMLVTNGWSNCDPFYVTRMIGPQTHAAIKPFRFGSPPRVRINGHVPLRHYSKADLYFDLEEGKDFTYWRFRLPKVTGNIHWKFDDLTITNVQVAFYGGKADWEGAFKFDPNDIADFSFRSHFEGADLKPLVNDLFFTTNHMEGTLSGELTITSARTDDPLSWNGYGSVKLYDGFLWSIPIFGVFSPMLDSINSGLGSSRITAGTATYTVTNSVVYTPNMEARATAFRLKYRGTVDLDGNLDARAEAMFLRDAWLVGRVFSLALWPVSKVFEARVTGTLKEPKTRLRYMPQFLTAPFRALHRLRRPAQNAQPSLPSEAISDPDEPLNLPSDDPPKL